MNTEQMPREWQTSIICPIWKKGDKLVCNNFRSILLLCVPHKLFTSILQDEVKLSEVKQGDVLSPHLKRCIGTCHQTVV